MTSDPVDSSRPIPEAMIPIPELLDERSVDEEPLDESGEDDENFLEASNNLVDAPKDGVAVAIRAISRASIAEAFSAIVKASEDDFTLSREPSDVPLPPSPTSPILSELIPEVNEFASIMSDDSPISSKDSSETSLTHSKGPTASSNPDVPKVYTKAARSNSLLTSSITEFPTSSTIIPLERTSSRSSALSFISKAGGAMKSSISLPTTVPSVDVDTLEVPDFRQYANLPIVGDHVLLPEQSIDESRKKFPLFRQPHTFGWNTRERRPIMAHRIDAF